VTSKYIICGFILFAYPLVGAGLDSCKMIRDGTKRLACYDEFHGYMELTKENDSDEVELKQKPENSKSSGFALLPHKQSFFMPVSYNTDRRPVGELLGGTTDKEFDNLETKFQISFKMSLWDEIFDKDSNLMVAYSQKSYWQMYNSDLSSPFRETNYEPEVFISKKTNIDIFGLDLSEINIGFVHESNGRSNLFSRSWNRGYAKLILQNDNFVLSMKPWIRVNEDLEDDDNPDIEDYLGHYELSMLYQWHDTEFSVMLRNLNSDKHQETYQVNWLFPINRKIDIYFEYFHGYGESLIDYGHLSKTFGVGFSINDSIE